MPPVTSQLLGEEAPPIAPYDFLHVNRFVYRCNKVTGEMWRLAPSAQDKKAHVWTLIEDAPVTH